MVLTIDKNFRIVVSTILKTDSLILSDRSIYFNIDHNFHITIYLSISLEI